MQDSKSFLAQFQTFQKRVNPLQSKTNPSNKILETFHPGLQMDGEHRVKNIILDAVEHHLLLGDINLSKFDVNEGPNVEGDNLQFFESSLETAPNLLDTLQSTHALALQNDHQPTDNYE